MALVTGGGRGIGRGITLEFAREGADVAINYRRDREAAETTAGEVQALGRRAVVLQADVSDREAVEAMVAEAVASLGRLDVVVANSGVAARLAPVASVDPVEWRRVLATDLDGAFWTARAAVPHVVAQRGVLLFISSVGADLAGAGGAPRGRGVPPQLQARAAAAEVAEAVPLPASRGEAPPARALTSYLDELVRGSSPCARELRARRAARPVSAGRPAHADY